jgi:hypothetical protein
VPPAASRSSCCIDPWPLAPARGGRGGGEVAAGKKTVAPWGRRRPAGVREPATAGPTLLLQGVAWPRGDGKRWRPSSTRQRPPPAAQARFAKGRRRRPWICLTGGAGCTSHCRIRAWGGRGRSDDGEGGGVEHVVDGRDAAPLLRARAGRGRSSPSPPSAVLAVEDAPSSRSAGISAAPRELRSAPAAQISRAGRTARYIPVRRGEGDGWGHAVSARGRALLAGSVAGRLLAKSRRGGREGAGRAAVGMQRPQGCACGGHRCILQHALRLPLEAATVPPASAKRRCSTGCSICWRWSNLVWKCD